MCEYCEIQAKQYDLKKCIQCAARLVRSARPSRRQQEKMLAYVSRWHDPAEVKAIVVEKGK
jgi:hypothetical protein